MKVEHGEKHVLGHSGLQEIKDFEIRNSAHAFKILSSGLYSDKIMAVLREIGCNAYDAHVEFGCTDKPFHVKLPNQLDPQFYIRDFGPGLSHEKVMKLYTTYFASTKQESNDFTGAFGLGSKSPFSYTDAFTITSVHGGKKRIYTAHIGDRGCPVVALMGESDAPEDWAHGLEIGFSVKPQDFTEFSQKAARCYRGFRTIPKVLGGQPIKPLKTIEDFGEYAFLDGENGIFALMGNVLYPIIPEKLRDSGKRDPFLEAGMSMNSMLLRFDIGALQVAASREELQYDPRTQKAITDRLIKAVKDALGELKSLQKDVTTWAEMCKFQETKENITRGIRINSELLKAAGVKDKVMELYNSNYARLPNISSQEATYCIIQEAERGGKPYLKTNRPASATGTDLIEYADNIKIVTGVEKNGYARVKKAYKDNVLAGRTILITPKHKDATPTDLKAIEDKLLKVMPGVDVLPLADFDLPITMKTRRKKGQLLTPDVTVILDGQEVQYGNIPSDRYVYIRKEVRSSWQRRTSKFFLDGVQAPYREGLLEIMPYEWDQIWYRVSDIRKHIKTFDFQKPVEFTKAAARAARFDKRSEWVPFREYAAKQLAKKDHLDALSKLVEDHKPIVDIRFENGQGGPFESLVMMKQWQPKLFAVLEPLLIKRKLMDDIEEVHKRSWAAKDRHYDSKVEPSVLTSYKAIAAALKLTIDTPQFKAATLSMDGKFQMGSGMDYHTLCRIGKVSKDALINVVDAIIL